MHEIAVPISSHPSTDGEAWYWPICIPRSGQLYITSGLALPTCEALCVNNHAKNHVALNAKQNYVVPIRQVKSYMVDGTALGYLSRATDIDVTTFLVLFIANLGYHWVWISLPRISHLPIMWTTLLCM